MSENKTSKYFKYAIGEIILVVIGILIALQINTWNEQRKERIKSREFHQRIIEDLDLMINTMNGEVKRSLQVKKYILSSINILQKNTLNKKDKDTLDYAFKNYFQFTRIDGSLKSIEEMKSSGQLGLIYNKELRKDIDNFLGYLGAISKIYEQIGKIVNDDAIIEKYLFLKVADYNRDNEVIYDFNLIRKDRALRNKLSKIAVGWQSKRSFSEKILNGSKILKLKIQEELDK